MQKGRTLAPKQHKIRGKRSVPCVKCLGFDERLRGVTNDL